MSQDKSTPSASASGFPEFSELPELTAEQKEMRLGFVLLQSPEVDWKAFLSALERDWGIGLDERIEDGALVFELDGMLAACAFVASPIAEAAKFAKNNFFWDEGVEVTESHKAQVIVSVLRGEGPMARSLLYSKLVSSLLTLENALGVYQVPTVFTPDYFRQVAGSIKDSIPPVPNWVYFGLYNDLNGGVSGYTYGLAYFGKEEIEVVNSAHTPEEVYRFLMDMAFYVVGQNTTLEDGDTIGFNEDEEFAISRSPGIAVENQSLKISF